MQALQLGRREAATDVRPPLEPATELRRRSHRGKLRTETCTSATSTGWRATRSGQLALDGFLDELLLRVRADRHGTPTDIFPRLAESSEPRPVRISPVVSFGYPTIRDTGIRTSAVASRFDAGEDIDDIARDYGVAHGLIADAIRFQVAAA